MRPAAAGGIEIYFNVGSKVNNAATSPSETVGLSASGGASFVGNSGPVQMVGDSIQRVVVNDTGNSLSVAAPVPIATGLRNAAGMTFDGAGNLWFEDNGIDTPTNLSVSLSADTLHVIPASLIGVTVPTFGFAGTYVDYATGAIVGPTAGVTLLAIAIPLKWPAVGMGFFLDRSAFGVNRKHRIGCKQQSFPSLPG
jgi:hypothetical protein